MNAVKQEESDHIDIDVKIEILMDIKREEGYFDEFNEEEGGVGGDDVGGGDVVVKEEELEEMVEEVVVGVKRKAEEETEPKKTKKRRNGYTNPWTKEEEDALLKGAGKYGTDWKRIKKEDDGKVLADRTPDALQLHLHRRFPEKYKELRAANPRKKTPLWTKEEVKALKRGVKEHGKDWDKIISDNEVLKHRTPIALKIRYNKHLRE